MSESSGTTQGRSFYLLVGLIMGISATACGQVSAASPSRVEYAVNAVYPVPASRGAECKLSFEQIGSEPGVAQLKVVFLAPECGSAPAYFQYVPGPNMWLEIVKQGQKGVTRADLHGEPGTTRITARSYQGSGLAVLDAVIP